MTEIIFDAERMKYPNTGLYYFCLFLGNELVKFDTSNELGLYLPESSFNLFPEGVSKIKPRAWHKIAMPKLSDIRVWHTTYQLSSYHPPKKNIDIVLTVHDLNFFKEGKTAGKEKRYLKKLQDNINRASKIVTISNYVKTEIEEFCNLQGKPVQVIYNGSNFNAEEIAGTATVNPHDKPFLFTIGTIVAKKNFHVLPYLLVNNDLDLFIAGITQDESYKEKIISVAKECGVEDRVKFLGAISEKEKISYMKFCEMFVFPSIAEGFGLPVVEAMALGKKTLLSKLTSLPEIGGDLSYYLDNFEEDYLRQFGGNELIKLLDREVQSAEIIEWSKQFKWDQAAKSYWEVYKSLLHGR